MEKASCAKCKHRRDVLVPCEWLRPQSIVVVSCPHFEPREVRKLEAKEENENAQHEV